MTIILRKQIQNNTIGVLKALVSQDIFCYYVQNQTTEIQIKRFLTTLYRFLAAISCSSSDIVIILLV